MTIGVDLGQKSDYTAVVVAEEHPAMKATRVPAGGALGATVDRHERSGAPSSWTARDVSRLPLHTPYPEVAARIAQVVERLRAQRIYPMPGVEEPAVGSIRVVADATGVGVPVVELIREALKPHKVPVIAATFTYGRGFSKHDAQRWTVGKAFLVGRVQAILQDARLKMPPTAEVRALADELEHYEIRVSEAAKETFGAFSTGKHDDLATALGLAILEDTPVPGQIRRPGARGGRHVYA